MYDLKSRNVLITGGSRGIGAAISTAFAREGANVAINYNSNATAAISLVKTLTDSFPSTSKIVAIQGDVSTKTGCESLVQSSIDHLGGLDIIISNAGYTKFTENFGDLDSLTEEDWDKCYAVNVKAQLWLFNAFKPVYTSNPDGGVFLICSSVAGIQPGGSSMAYSVTKAAALHLMRCLVASQGPKIRVNAVLPGLVLTEWGSKFSDAKKEAITNMAMLKKVTAAEDVADMFVSMAKNDCMTGQRVAVDCGLVP